MTIAIEQLLADQQECHSDFQIDWFVLNLSGETPFGAYIQCLRELSSRHAVLQGINGKPVWWRSLWVWMTRRKPTSEQLAVSARHRADVQREYDRLLMHARRLKVELGELTPKRRAKLEWEMWYRRLKNEAALDFYAFGALSRGTAETMFKVPPEMRRAILGDLVNREAVLAWLETAEAPRLPGAPGGNGRPATELQLEAITAV